MLEIHNIAGLVCKTLDLALTPKSIKSGFRAAGIVPFDPDIFTDADFIQAVQLNAIEAATEVRFDEEEQRRIVVTVGPGVGREAEVLTSPSTSRASLTTPEPSTSRASSASGLSFLDEIGPMQGTSPKKPSNRGRKSMKTTVLTSPESVVVLREKAKRSAERAAKRASVTPQKKQRGRPQGKRQASPAKPSTKRTKQKTSPPSDDDVDFCLICLQLLPRKLTAANSNKCNECQRPVHSKCVDMRASYFTCKHCLSDSVEEDDE